MHQEFGFEDPTFSVETAIRMLQSQMSFLGRMWLDGEISEFSVYRGVNWYFTVKDFDNVKVTLRCAMFQKHTKGSPRPNTGDRVSLQGEFKLKRGNVQFVVSKVKKLESRGNHEARLEELKQKLKAEGLFDEDRKRPLPKYPRRIGVVTSKESAALQDVLDVLRERLPTAQYFLSDTMTEGAQAAPEILRAIERLQLEGDCDVIIVTRGGGSRESLMGFNDEGVIRAVANCDVPVVCAIGHETDYTLAEMAADLRASTPTKAAQKVASISEVEIAMRLFTIRERLQQEVLRKIAHQRELLSHVHLKAPQHLLDVQRQRLGHLRQRLAQLVTHRLQFNRQHIESLSTQLETLSPQHILQKGYAVALHNDKPVTVAGQVGPGDRLIIQLAEGTIEVEVLRPPTDSPKEIQLSLFD